ncbi:CRE-PMP-5 protein [Caenorhabditis remanei]|uniref:CRE-PMP-5 protein n=1 Tax=Caenorhabditis remanei TaxID=31234 RepID=E3LTF3_CAERE|nr:CRE-PMP-5 protein [Caenorhabditis remanei]
MGKLQVIEKKFEFGFRVFYNLFRLLPLIYSNTWLTLGLTAVTIAASVGNEIVNYKTGVIPGKFYVALIEKDEPKFWHIFWVASLCYIGLCLLMALMNFFSWCLYIQQRKNLVQCLHKLYYRNNFYYQLNGVDDQGIDNPLVIKQLLFHPKLCIFSDQRITQDADKLTKLLGTSIIPTVLLSPFIISYYGVKVWNTAGGWGFGMIFAYFAIGVIINRILIGPITPWAARVEKAEGDFRYKHVSVRVNAEESAFFKSAEFEHMFSNLSFDVLFRRLFAFMCWRFPSQFFQSFFDYYGGCMSYILQLFPLFVFHMYDNLKPADLSGQIKCILFHLPYQLFHKTHRFGNEYRRTWRIYHEVQYTHKNFLTSFFRVSEFVDNGKLYQTGIENDAFRSNSDVSDTKTSGDENLIEAEHLSFGPPTNSNIRIIENLTFNLPRNRTMLITGDSGIGKTSLMRVIADMWPHEGTLNKHYEKSDAYFLPQRPYFPVGRLSLKQQLVFPAAKNGQDFEKDGEIVQILNELKLGHLIQVVGSIYDNVDFEWQETLSPGEQQRLCFARMLLAEPTIAFLDESTCNVDEGIENAMYEMLRKRSITYITVGHRKSLRSHHDFELRIPSSSSFLFHEIHSQKL